MYTLQYGVCLSNITKHLNLLLIYNHKQSVNQGCMETTVISGASVKTGSLAIVYSDIVQMIAKEAGGGPRVYIEKEVSENRYTL